MTKPYGCGKKNGSRCAWWSSVKAHDCPGTDHILPLDNRAAIEFKRLRDQRIRIGTMDLKIASIALMHDTTLVSGNQAA